jgi:hypothetical protein
MKLRPENEMLIMCIIGVLIIILAAVLSGCTTKTVYVPSSCPKPNIPAPPRDYMGELKRGAAPPEFVRACILGNIDARTAYFRCAHVCGGYE